jgi:hypothetical protein
MPRTAVRAFCASVCSSYPRLIACLGWLGWDNNLAGFASAVAELGIEEHLRGVATNVANYQPLGEPCPVHICQRR